jgi:hypothetical protein
MADARSGIDELARLTRKGVVFLKDRDGSGPEINTKGQITYTVPPFGDHPRVFQLRLKNSFSSAARVLYRSRITLGATAWGPRQAIAQVVGGHPPGTKGPRPRLVVVAKNGTTRTIRTRIGNQLSNVIWGDATRTPIAVSGWNSHSEILNPDGSETPLPPGWVPEAWNPSGTMLLVFKLGSSPGIGLWSPRFPRKIHPLGSFSPRVQVGQVAWLAQPARE